MKQSQLILALAALLIMGAGGGWLARLSARRELGQPGVRVARVVDENRLRILLPERVRDYDSQAVEPTEAELTMLPDDTTMARRIYTATDGFEIMLTVVLMGTDRTSIHKPEYCLTSQAWQIVDRSTISLDIERPTPYALPIREFVARRLIEQPDGSAAQVGGVYLFWFVADGRLTASHYQRLLSTTEDLLRTGRLSRWAYVSCFATCKPGREPEASARVQAFIAAAVPEFQTTTLAR